MYPIPIYKPSKDLPSYVTLNQNYQVKDNSKIPTYQNKVERLPDAPPLAINTDFRPETSRVLPVVPASYMFNYGFQGAKPNVSSMFGTIPQTGSLLAKIGTENFKVLEPVNLYANLPMKC